MNKKLLKISALGIVFLLVAYVFSLDRAFAKINSKYPCGDSECFANVKTYHFPPIYMISGKEPGKIVSVTTNITGITEYSFPPILFLPFWNHYSRVYLHAVQTIRDSSGSILGKNAVFVFYGNEQRLSGFSWNSFDGEKGFLIKLQKEKNVSEPDGIVHVWVKGQGWRKKMSDSIERFYKTSVEY